jgi:aspartate-semialdehyde dehydrogenase
MGTEAAFERRGEAVTIAEGMYRIAIVGASSLAGKELADELGESLLAASDVTLLDDEAITGTIAAVGDEAAVILPIDGASFERMDFVFFAGEPETTLKYWGAARMAGASIVDMTYALEGEAGVAVRAPFVRAALRRKAAAEDLDFATVAVVAATPAAVMLALVAERLQAKLRLKSLAATIFEPASEHGREAMDELHQQTVNLLSFQNLPKEQYDAQVAFNVLPSLGELARVDLGASAARIVRHYGLVGEGLPALEAQMVHGPVFHGYVASVLVELERDVRVDEVEAALEGEGIDVVAEESDPPSNLSAAGQEDIMVLVRAAKLGAELAAGRRFWLWLAADNLKLGALNAIACANELKRLRPRGSVQ